MNASPRYPELLDACRHLFGEIHASPNFLQCLRADGVKAAYRQKAKENHPDLFSHAPQPVRQAKEELFRKTHAAYEVLTAYLRQRKEPATPRHAAPPRQAPAAEQPVRKPQRPKKEGSYYTGSVPPRALPLGRFLYYSGVISYQSFIEALTWQRTNRMRLGSIAKKWGWLSTKEIQEVLNHPSPEKFGEKAVNMQLLTPLQVHVILMHQRSRNLRFGRYFVMRNEITHGEMETLVHALKRHNHRFATVITNDE